MGQRCVHCEDRVETGVFPSLVEEAIGCRERQVSDFVKSAQPHLPIEERTVEETIVGLSPCWLLRIYAVDRLWLGISRRGLSPWRIGIPRVHR